MQRNNEDYSPSPSHEDQKPPSERAGINGPAQFRIPEPAPLGYAVAIEASPPSMLIAAIRKWERVCSQRFGLLSVTPHLYGGDENHVSSYRSTSRTRP